MRRAFARKEGLFEDLPTLETERLVLRKMALSDAEAMFAYASDPEVTRYTLWETHRSMEDSEGFLRFMVERYRRGETADWGIVYKGTGRFVGTCGFMAGYYPEDDRAEMGYVLSRKLWGRGLMPEAVRAVISFGFGRLGLNRIEARCIAENTASARVMQKAGMTHEGTLRQREFVKGAHRDIKLYAILRSEHRPR